MINSIRDLLRLHEGVRRSAYQDSLGYWTIGVGHLIDARKGGELPDTIINDLLSYDIDAHQHDIERALPWVKDLSFVRFVVLTVTALAGSSAGAHTGSAISLT